MSGLNAKSVKATLALADGTVFVGEAFGAEGKVAGEIVFNTSMTGYQEILTDPSYCQQIITLTQPHIRPPRVIHKPITIKIDQQFIQSTGIRSPAY